MTPARLSLLLALVGCSASEDLMRADYDSANAESDVATRSIRVDVLPSGDVDAMPQSLVFGDGAWDDLDLDLAPTIQWTGTVTGTVSNPYAADFFDIEVPGEADVPLEADLQALVVGQRDGAATITNNRGAFSLSVPEGGPYRVTVVPVAEAPVPFLVLEEEFFSADVSEQALDLGAGQAVFGTVLQEDGAPLPQGALARLEHLATGVVGPAVPVNPNGHFLLRALPGDYRVLIGGDKPSSFLPRIAQSVTVTAEEPSEVDLTVGVLEPVAVEMEVEGAADPSGLSVRFVSEELALGEGSATVEPFGVGGQFRTELLPGIWTVEVLPDFNPNGQESPLRLEGVVVTAGQPLDLGAVSLPSRVQVSGVVRSAQDDSPLANVIVSAREVGFEGNVFSGRTDEDGRYTLEVPDVALDVSYSPAVNTETTTWVSVDNPDDLGDLRLSLGEPVGGQVLLEGEPVPFSVVEVRDGASGALYATTFTDAEGFFAVRIDHRGSVGDISQPGVDTGFDSGL